MLNNRRLEPLRVQPLGPGPVELELPHGSYLLRMQVEGHLPLNLPLRDSPRGEL